MHEALNAQFEIIRELGRGGTALVYLAKDRSTGAEVAIKLIRAKYIDDEEALGRFAREARFVAQLHHPNIVPVRAVIDLGTAGLALVMEHVNGRTLKQVIRADGRLGPARTEQILRDVAGALGAAHAMGIVHRDVKPENIFIEASGRAILADFGLARSMTADTQLTMTGVAIGTPAYMAPEQIEGDELDARGDVYSLGLVGWEMLSGHRPWDGDNLYGVLYHQKHDFLTDVRDLRDDVPDRLAEVILRAIEKDRERRWQSMREFVRGLDDSTALQAAARRAPATTETTRFVRPAPIEAAAPAPLPAPQRMSESLTPAEMPSAVPSVLPPVLLPAASERRVVTPFRAAVVTVGIVGVALITAVVRGLSTSSSPRATDTAVRPILAGDVAKAVPIGPPIGPPIDSTKRLPDTAPRMSAAPAITVPDDSSRKQPAPKVTLPPLSTLSSVVARLTLKDTETNRNPPSANGSAVATHATPASPIPVPAGRGAAPTTVRTSVVAGGMHSCLMTADGRVFCWGNNASGQLGSGNTTRSTAPVVVSTSLRFGSLSAGLSHSCALTRDGAAWCWGSNDHGQLGDRSFNQRAAPVPVADNRVFRNIATGAMHTCALDTDGLAWCWGSDARGQLGADDNSARDSGIPVAASGAGHFSSVVAGWNFNCALATTGRASCWGENSGGQLGDGTTSDRPAPTPIASEMSFTSIAAGSAHACGITARGEAFCWGRNSNGQLGDGTTTDRNTPVRVRSNVHFASISAGAVHTCAVTTDGEAYCWGRNTYGQLGIDTYVDEAQPTSVAGNHVFASVRAFGSHTCGTTVSGEAFCWGYNLESQLGDGTRIHRARPVHVETPGGG